MNSTLRPFPGLCLLLLIAPFLGAQETAEPSSEEPFFETVNVNLVNVEVFVTDKDGRAVNGLSADDFEIFDDGRPVAITNFYAAESGRPRAEAPTTAESPADDEPSSAKEIEPAKTVRKPEIPDDQKLHLVVYVDNFNIRPLNRNRVFKRLREFLIENLNPLDRVMLVSYDRTLDIRHPFTTDSARVARTLFTLQKDSGHATQRDNERRTIRRAIEEAENIGEISGRVRQYASSVENDLRFTLDALRDTVGSQLGLPGRKALLYVSDGLPLIPGQDLFWSVERRFLLCLGKFFLNNVSTPARYTGYGKYGCHEIQRYPHHVVNRGTVEIHIGFDVSLSSFFEFFNTVFFYICG